MSSSDTLGTVLPNAIFSLVLHVSEDEEVSTSRRRRQPDLDNLERERLGEPLPLPFLSSESPFSEDRDGR